MQQLMINIDVENLEDAIRFYEQALGLNTSATVGGFDPRDDRCGRANLSAGEGSVTTDVTGRRCTWTLS